MKIIFAGEADKRGKTGWSYVTPVTRSVVERLLATEAVQASGIVFPNRQRLTARPLKKERKTIQPARAKDFDKLIHEAEALTRQWAEEGKPFRGVKHIRGRAFHGVNRVSVTIQGSEDRNMEVAAKQAGTSVQMLQRVYHQAHSEDRADLMVNIGRRRKRRSERGRTK